jgi:predicted amidohydrolase
MKIALIQTRLEWENSSANRTRFSDKINSLENADLIVLPEMFSTGFTMHPSSVAESMDGETVTWMKKMAIEKGIAICGSVVISEQDKYYNRLLFVLPSGEIRKYDKRHLFTLAGEDKAYTAGTERLIVEYKGFRICPLICYDLRFPVFSRNTENYDLLLYVANWPEPRIAAWDTLLRARAIENMSFVLGVNRVGKDSNGHNYIGHSQAFDALGNSLLDASESDEILIVDLNKNALLETRQKFGFLNDRDAFTVV